MHSRGQDPYYDGVPAYMVDVYDWCYVNPKRAALLDRGIVVKTLLFGNDQRLIRAYLAAIRPAARVWQVAHVYGNVVQRAADAVGPQGVFHVTDVTPVQVEHAAQKLAEKPWSHVFCADAATFEGGDAAAQYDLICSFMLLHEVPDDKKRQIIKNMLDRLAPEGSLLLIDYHRPAWWQPIRWILKIVNAWLEPFAAALWSHDFSFFTENPEKYVWKKQTIFGGVYQIVTVTRSKQKD